MEGSTFAGYRLESLIGRGGMGEVWRAVQLALDRPVALKLLPRHLSGDATFRERFKRESMLAASIDHPNVIPVYEAGEHDGHLFIAMRFVDGIDAQELLNRQGPLPAARAVRIVAQVAAALDAAHARGLVHRDVKPANILLTADDHAYLTDFGITKAHNAPGLTQTGMVLGTPGYIAPEQAQGQRADARADVYALGCVLHQLVTGSVPFPRDSDMAMLLAHVVDAPPKPSEARPGVPEALDAVVLYALNKDPANRFATAGDLARAAEQAVGAAGRAVAPTSTPPPTLAPVTPHPSETVTPAQPRRRPALALGAILLVVALVGVGIVALAGGGGGGGDDATATATATATAAPPPQARVAARVPVAGGPDGIDVDGGEVWVSSAKTGRLNRIDERSAKPKGRPVPVGRNPDGVAVARGVVWVANTDDDQVARFDIGNGLARTGTIDVGDAPEPVSLGRQLGWVANTGDGTVNRFDRASASRIGGPIGVGTRPSGIFVGEAFVWVTNFGDDTVQRIDVAAAEPVGDPIAVGDGPRGVVESGGFAWVANSAGDSVTRLDAASGRVVGRPIPVGDDPRELAAGFGSIWVANTNNGTVTRIDAKTAKPVGDPIRACAGPLGVAAGSERVWVACFRSDRVVAIDPRP